MKFIPARIFVMSILLSLFSFSSWAQSTTPVEVPPVLEKAIAVPAAVPTEVMPVETPVITNPRTPYKYFGSANYAAVDMPIVSKWGLTAGYLADANHIWELEYMTGSFGSSILFADIGKITDTKISIQRRVYYGGSFNITYGLSYFNFTAKLGDALMSNVSNNNYPSLDMVEIQAYGATFGMGNTWVIRKNIVLGVDWLTISQPLYITKKETPYLDYSTDPGDRDNVETATNFISYLPRVSLIQLHVGMLF